jgi:hypothetical protein
MRDARDMNIRGAIHGIRDMVTGFLDRKTTATRLALVGIVLDKGHYLNHVCFNYELGI